MGLGSHRAVGPVQVEEHILKVEGSNMWTVKFSEEGGEILMLLGD